MEQKTARKLELELEKTIGDVVVRRLGLKSLPLMPSQATMLMMAKAAGPENAAVELGSYRNERSVTC